jgi:PAS domain S-box-containing protein
VSAEWRELAVDRATLARIVEALPDATLVIDDDGRVVLANAIAEGLLQFARGALIGRRIEEFVPERFQTAHRQHRAEFAASPRRRPMPGDYVLAARRCDGSEIPVDISLAPVSIGGVAHVMALIRAGGPSTRVVQERARLIQQTELLALRDRAITAGSLEECNQCCLDALAELLELERAELFEVAHAGQGWRARLVASTLPLPLPAAWSGMPGGLEFDSLLSAADAPRGPDPDSIDLQVLSKDDEAILSLPIRGVRRVFGILRLVRPAPRGFGADAVYVARNIAQLLGQLNEQFERDRLDVLTAKLEVLGQLSGGLAHDFNNLLGVISGNLDLLENQLGGNRDAIRLLATARRAVTRGSDLTHRMLTVARKRPLSIVPINLVKAMPGLLQLVRSAIGERIALEVSLPTEVAPIWGDMTLLDTCVLNLATNARDAMPDGGTLGIVVEERDLDLPLGEVHSGAFTPGPHVVVCVSDSGRGMSDEVKARVFEPFFTTKEGGRGSGLGLKMVAALMHQVGGRICLSSEPDRGTRACLCFRAADVAEEPGEQPSQVVQGSGQRVLVVEDDEALRDTAVTLLGDIGYRSAAAATVGEALVALDSHPDIALVFSDVVLAHGETGVQLAELVLQRDPQLPILLTSGYASPVLERCGPLLARLPLLSKPYTREQLAAAVRSALLARTAPATES